MAANAKIIDLRNLLAERFSHPPVVTAACLVTGLPFLDKPIGGGLPRGAITELISPARAVSTPIMSSCSDAGQAHRVPGGPQISTGSASIIHALIYGACRDHCFLALIDGCDSFDPCGLDDGSLRHLLWVRCSKASEAIKAADLLLRDGNFPLVIVDLVLNAQEELRNIPQTNWYRLQRLAEMVPTACLVLTRYEMVGSAQLKVILENSRDLEGLERQSPVSRLRIIAKRSHPGRHIVLRGAEGAARRSYFGVH